MKRLIGVFTTMAMMVGIAAANTFYADAEAMPPLYEDAIEETITAYCSCVECCGKTDGITASGVSVRSGICASNNPNYYGKLIAIYNEDWSLYGYFECLDKGPEHIDLYFDSHQEAVQFGKQTKYIRVINGVG